MTEEENEGENHDDYDEDITEVKFLKSKPTCFIILGKPGCGKSILAKRLSQIWRCQLLNPTEMIQREIENSTEMGREMQEKLMNGEALTTEYVVEAIKKKMQTPEISHYGYVLEGLPTLDHQDMSIDEQLVMIKKWKLNPDFIINIRIPDGDLKTRLCGIRVDPLTGDVYIERQWSKKSSDELDDIDLMEDSETMEEEEEEGGEPKPKKPIDPYSLDFPSIEQATKDRLVRLPENFDDFAINHVDDYQHECIPLTDNFISNHNKQNVIELDGNEAPTTLFHQLVSKLESYPIKRAIVPQSLMNNGEEEEANNDMLDGVDTDELLRTVASYQMSAPAHRWRRSKWSTYCPVALRDGKILPGKPQFSVSFLDKIYVMSSAQAMSDFIRNPRPYLLPPYPQVPCKLSIIGHPYAGKSDLAHQIADHYDAEVIDMDELMKPLLEEEKNRLIQKAYDEAVKSAIETIGKRLHQEAVDRAKARKQAAKEEEEENEEDEEDGDDEKDDDYSGDGSVSPIPEVTENDEEVQELAKKSTEGAVTQVTLPPEEYMRVLMEKTEEISARRMEENPDAPKYGGWILDNFPQTKEHWTAMLEIPDLVPDQYFVLHDLSPTQDVIRKKYYDMNREQIEKTYRERAVREKQAEIEKAKENLEKGVGNTENAAEAVAPAPTPEGGEVPPAEDASKTKQEGEETPAVVQSPKEILKQLKKELKQLRETIGELPPHDIPEFVPMKLEVEDNMKIWAELQVLMDGQVPIKIQDLSQLSGKKLFDDCIQSMTDLFKFSAWEFGPQDIEEEEEDINNLSELMEGGDQDEEEEDNDDEDEDEEDEEKTKQKKRRFGCSNHWDIVELQDKEVFWPGDPEISADYRQRVYIFATTDNRDKFISNPLDYVAKNQPLFAPAFRLLMLGVRGSGKTLNGRWLAKKLNIFHISFREKLQEMILPKTGRKLGAEHEEDKLLNEEMKLSIEEAVKQASDEYATMLAQNQQNGEEEEEEEESQEQPTQEEEGEEEDEFANLSPDQLAIKNYLVDDEPLPVEILDQIIPQFWKEEPFKTTGFILEGFPRHADECQYLQENGFFPDMAVTLALEEDDVIKRLLKPRMDKWKARKEHQEKKKSEINKAKVKLRKEAMEKRRKELIEEKMREKLERAEDEEEEEEEEEEDDEDEIENQLEEEFPEDEDEDEEEEQEEVDEANERMTTEISEAFEDESGKIDSVKEQLEEIKISTMEIPANRKPSIVQYHLKNKLKPVLDYRKSLFEKCYPVNMQYANKLLNAGYKHPSAFGYWDPVELRKGEMVVSPPIRDFNHPSFPVVHNQFIYFLSSAINRTTFMENPLYYTKDCPDVKPVVPLQLAVVGPPKSGKSNLSNRFAQEYGLLHVSIGKAIRRILTDQSHTKLAQHINEYLYNGRSVPDHLSMQAVANMLLDTKTTTRGYVLDGCPLTKKQAEILRSLGIIPIQVINLQTNVEESIKRALQDREINVHNEPVHDSGRAIALKHKILADELDQLEQFYTENHQNWTNINCDLSKWKIWNLINEQSLKNVRTIQDYIHRTNQGEAGKLQNLCISPSEFQSRVGIYGHYCPVAINDNEELIDCSKDNLQLAVEYDGKYYKCSSKAALDKFLLNPKQYVPPEARMKLPADLPRRITPQELREKFPKQFQLGGYCPVTYVNGKLKYAALKEGDEQYAAEYLECLFIFESEQKLEMFMRKPTKYCDVKLPKKLPPKKLKINLVELPVLGYLEQQTVDLIIKSMNEVGCIKPKLPFLSVKNSALYYMACYLKAHNDKSSEFSRQIFREKLKKLEAECDLIKYLGNNMTPLFKEPLRRPQDFDQKMETFLSFSSGQTFQSPLKI